MTIKTTTTTPRDALIAIDADNARRGRDPGERMHSITHHASKTGLRAAGLLRAIRDDLAHPDSDPLDAELARVHEATCIGGEVLHWAACGADKQGTAAVLRHAGELLELVAQGEAVDETTRHTAEDLASGIAALAETIDNVQEAGRAA